jgi:hypothetical protein
MKIGNVLVRCGGLVIATSLWFSLAGFGRAVNPGDCLTNDAAFQSGGGGCQDLSTGRVWSYQPDGNWTFDGAKNYCANLVEGGQTDWRMATISELESVVSNGGYTHLALTISLNGWLGHNWSTTGYKGKVDYYAIRFSDGEVVVRGTKPGSKNGYWALANICVR